ncbi:hypothetical protein [Roseateles chitosanitabidus]|uniref:hypothetical protein n=1 Tax=Roseateles chitosanitabidus TaxID=65048 RepID=UPI0011DF57D9|nr:hypothetical protein [Roseateles chitosanitabidus]
MRQALLILKAQFPKDYFARELNSLPHIPCVCRIGGGRFLVEFSEPLIEVEGEVLEFDISDIDRCAPAGGGGEYIHYSFATITLIPEKEDLFVVRDLSFFKGVAPGWFSIIKDGFWGAWAPGPVEESQSPVFVKERQSKRRKRLLEPLKRGEDVDGGDPA